MLKLKQTSNICCMPIALVAKRQISSAYITWFIHCLLILHSYLHNLAHLTNHQYIYIADYVLTWQQRQQMYVKH